MAKNNKKVCLISDIHFGNKKGVKFFLDSMEVYFCDELIPYLNANKIKHLLILGDFFDTRTSVDVRVSNVVFKILKQLKESKIQVTMLLGNHDIFLNSSINIHSLKYFELFDNIEIIDRITTKEIYGRNVTMFPWQTDNIFQSMDYSNSDLAFGHFAINGCALNKSQFFEGGTLQSFFHDNFKHTFTGHFHTPGVYKGENGNEIIYIGAPYHLNRSDSNTDRGVIILDMETLEYERVSSKKTLKYVAFTYDKDLSLVDIPGNIIDVHVNINKDYDAKKLNEYVAQIENNPTGSPINVNVIPHYDLDAFHTEELSDDDIAKVKSIPEMINSKLLSMDVPDDIKQKTIKYISGLMNIIEQESVT